MSKTIISRFRQVRQYTEELVKNLSDADMTVQSMPDASPAKWHLAHTTWFFETFILKAMVSDYAEFDAQYSYLFNSYYESVGQRQSRALRGLLTRPTKNEVLAYRTYVDEAMLALMDARYGSDDELPQNVVNSSNKQWLRFDATNQLIGHDFALDSSFAYDNEGPQHKVYIPAFEIASDLVTNKEWLAFIEDGAYQKPLLWLADGWAVVQQQKWEHPLYWVQKNNQWYEMTLHGLQKVDWYAPVRHISYFEADAYASWLAQSNKSLSNVRLPTEYEWELAASTQAEVFNNAFGQVWQWTKSPYIAYPGFKIASGAVGEYNGKFMCNQFVLKGSSSVTSVGHERITYRNFFYPQQRWQFMGLRLASDL